MNPTNDKLTQQQTEKPVQEGPQKKKRFQFVRLEERIAPKSANSTDHGPRFTHRCPSF